MAIYLLIEITVARPLIINNLVFFFLKFFKKKIVTFYIFDGERYSSLLESIIRFKIVLFLYILEFVSCLILNKPVSRIFFCMRDFINIFEIIIEFDWSNLISYRFTVYYIFLGAFETAGLFNSILVFLMYNTVTEHIFLVFYYNTCHETGWN